MTDWLMSMVEPMIARALVSLGIGYISFSSITQIFDGVVSSIQSAFSGLGPNVLQLCTMYGLREAIGILFGGVTFSLSLISLKRFKIF